MGAIHYIRDRLQNALTGQGTGRDARTAGRYVLAAPLTQHEITAAWRSSGLLRKIITIPALDMVREWRDWKAEADQITAIEAEEKRLMLRQKVRQCEVLRGRGGGAMILGLPGDPSQPAPRTVTKGGLAYVNVVSRWQLQFASVQDDARDPLFGEPLMYRMTLAAGSQVDIHPSRVIPFRADTTGSLADSMSMGGDVEAFWGESTVAQVLDAVKDSDTARASFAALLHKARLLRIGIPGLMDLVSTSAGSTLVMERLATLATAESIHNATIFDSGQGKDSPAETITDATYNFAGAKDVLSAYAEFVAAISDIPATRLLGRAPEGMNASGDSQQQDWRKKVRAMQTLDLAPCLDRLDGYLLDSSLGSRPDGVWYDWAPLDQPGEKENAERFKLQMEAVEKLGNLAAIPERAFARGVQSLMIDEGYLPELEAALAEIPEDERWGIEPELEPDPLDDPSAVKGGDPTSAGEGGSDPIAEPPRRAANDTWFTTDATPKPLYVQRKLLNAADVIAWAKAQGFTTTLPADDMHVTVLFSRQAVDPMKLGENWSSEADGGLTIKPGGPRAVEKLGEDAVVLLFASWSLSSRHREMVEAGGSPHDYPEYQPHVTLSYSAAGVDLAAIKPYTGELRFGPELFEPLDLNWKAKISEDE